MNNWYWIELIGFDREAEDYGVGHFFEVTSAKIEGISLLFADMDFVNMHDGITGKTLRPGDCSYGAQECSEERRRQEWTDKELRGLVAEIHKRGVKVTFAFFNMFLIREPMPADFVHKYDVARDYYNDECIVSKSINVLKRLSDGSFYEDVLFEQINRITEDYGFDGVHLADGVSSARQSIQGGDFSDDIVGQFLEYYPDVKIERHAPDKESYKNRRETIIRDYYYEFITFHSDRWERFYKKLYSKVKGMVILNQAWTCNPFEALYRYGIDYRKIQSEKSFGMMLEDILPNMPIYSKQDNAGYDSTEEDCIGYHYRSMLMQMSTKAYIPDTNLISLAPVKDTTEQWDALRHNPMELSKDFIRRSNIYIYDNGYNSCVSAPVFCLSNGIPKHDWDWIHKQLDDGKRGGIESICGYTALSSASSIYKELKQYIKERTYSSFELQYRLLLNGLDIGCMAEVSKVRDLKTPVLVTNFSLLTPEEQKAILESSVPTAIMSEEPICAEGFGFKSHYYFLLRNMPLYEGIDADVSKLCSLSVLKRENNAEDDCLGWFTAPLRYSSLPKEYFAELAGILSKAVGLELAPEGVHITKHYLGDNRYRYFLSNDTHKYVLPEIRCKGTVKSAVSVLKYEGYKVWIKDNTFTDRIPPRGLCIVETEEI